MTNNAPKRQMEWNSVPVLCGWMLNRSWYSQRQWLHNLTTLFLEFQDSSIQKKNGKSLLTSIQFIAPLVLQSFRRESTWIETECSPPNRWCDIREFNWFCTSVSDISLLLVFKEFSLLLWRTFSLFKQIGFAYISSGCGALALSCHPQLLLSGYYLPIHLWFNEIELIVEQAQNSGRKGRHWGSAKSVTNFHSDFPGNWFKTNWRLIDVPQESAPWHKLRNGCEYRWTLFWRRYASR